MTVLLPALFVVLAWWLSTGVVLLINGLPRWTLRYSLIGISALAIAGGTGLVWSSRVATPGSAYLAFCCALAVWAWHELTFLTGVVTGPNRAPASPGTRGWRRFSDATKAVIHHELALAVTGAAILALTWDAPNQVGPWTFGVLWAMRLSAKLNLFLGVRSITTEFIPSHLRYLLSHFRRARLNPLMPISLIVASSGVAWLLIGSIAADATAFVRVGHALVATLLALAVLEHLFLAVPFKEAALWRWAVRPAIAPPAVAEADRTSAGSWPGDPG